MRPSVSATSLARMDAVLRVQMSVNAFLTGNLTDYVQNTSGLVPIAILKEAAAKTGQTRASVNQVWASANFVLFSFCHIVVFFNAVISRRDKKSRVSKRTCA